MTRRRRMLWRLGVTMEMVMVVGATVPGRAAPPSEVQMVEKVKPAVVMIKTTWTGSIAIRGQLRGKASITGHGSGFGVHEDGWIVTNGHVILGAGEVRKDLCLNFGIAFLRSALAKGADPKLIEEIKGDILRINRDGCSAIGATVVDAEGVSGDRPTLAGTIFRAFSPRG